MIKKKIIAKVDFTQEKSFLDGFNFLLVYIFVYH